MRRTLCRCIAAATGLFCLAISCTAPHGPLVVTDPDPTVKIPAIEIAAHDKDQAAIVQLVHDLQSDDPAVRFYAIEGLRRLTGQDLGYQFYADDDQRQEALERWQAWLAGHGSATRP